MTQHRRPSARLTATAVAVALVLTACGNAKGDPSASEATSSSTSTTTTTSIPTTTTAAPTTTTTTVAPVDVRALRPPAPAGDPAALAQQITAAETTIRDPLADPVAVATASLAHQVAYRQLGSHPEWDADVLAALPDGLRPSAALNAAARREFRGMHTKLSTALPAWQIVEPPPYEELMAVYAEASAAFGIPWEVLAAVNLVETGIGRIRGTSIAGAQGPMQFMPATWDAYGDGGDVNDTRDAIFGAARYLAANNGAVDIAHALYRYNHSERYVRGVQAYADLISEHPRAFLAYYHWGVWYLTEQGEVYLPIGYHGTEPVPVADYLAR